MPAVTPPAPPARTALAALDGTPARELWPLDERIVHLNHGSYGAAPRATVEHRARLLAEVDANPLAWHTGLALRYEAALADVAHFVGADPAALAFVPTASAGTTAVLRALLDGMDGEVLLTDHAYGAVAQHVAREAAHVGVRVVTVHVPLEADADETRARIVEAMTPATRLIVIDQITSGSARFMPVAALVEEAHARGIAVLVDAAHAPGMLADPFIAADAWVGNLHKWACGARGSAVLALRGDVVNRVRPPIESWGGDDFPGSFAAQGSADMTGYLATAAGLAGIEERIGWDRIRNYQAELVTAGATLVAHAFGELTGDDHRVEVGMPAPAMKLVALPGVLAQQPETGAALRQRIADELGFETQIAGFGGAARLRLSAHAYSTWADFERFADQVVPALVAWSRA